MFYVHYSYFKAYGGHCDFSKYNIQIHSFPNIKADSLIICNRKYIP